MNAPTSAQLRASADELREALAGAAAAVDGVVRLEPTLQNALRRLHAGTTVFLNLRGVRSAADGIELRQHEDVVDVHVDIVTGSSRNAARTAQAVQGSLRSVLLDRALEPGALTVAVLTIEQ